MMDCKTARFVMELGGPTGAELAPEERTSLDLHVSGCPACAERLERYRRGEAMLAKAMKTVPLPENLKKSIDVRLAQERGAGQRRRLWQAGACALAVAGVAVGIGQLMKEVRPTVSNNEVLVAFDKLGDHRNLDQLNRWLAEGGYQFSPEQPFNMALLSDYGYHRLKNRDVPMLVFSDPKKGRKAVVYILSAETFNLDRIRNEWTSGPDTSRHVKSLGDATQPGKYLYVIFSNEEDLKPFLDNSISG